MGIHGIDPKNPRSASEPKPSKKNQLPTQKSAFAVFKWRSCPKGDLIKFSRFYMVGGPFLETAQLIGGAEWAGHSSVHPAVRAFRRNGGSGFPVVFLGEKKEVCLKKLFGAPDGGPLI